jgi:hypothetical protein
VAQNPKLAKKFKFVTQALFRAHLTSLRSSNRQFKDDIGHTEAGAFAVSIEKINAFSTESINFSRIFFHH